MFTGTYSSSTILLHTKSKKSLTMNKLTYSLNTTHETKVVYFLYDNFPLQKQGGTEGNLTPNLIILLF